MGDGGAVTTDDDALADRIRMLRNYGHVRSTGARSSAGTVDSIRCRRQSWTSSWTRSTSGTIADVAWPPATLKPWIGSAGCAFPHEAAWARSVNHLFVVRVPCRDALVRHLSGASIETGMHYPIPPYRQPVYRHLGT